MTFKELTQRADTMSENGWLKVLGRFAQILGIPLIILLASRQLDKQDKVQDAMTTMGNRMTALEQKVDILQADPYKGSDAKKDFELRDFRITDLDGRVKALEYNSARRH